MRSHRVESFGGHARLAGFGHGAVGAGLLIAVGGPEDQERRSDDPGGLGLPREGAKKGERFNHVLFQPSEAVPYCLEFLPACLSNGEQ